MRGVNSSGADLLVAAFFAVQIYCGVAFVGLALTAPAHIPTPFIDFQF